MRVTTSSLARIAPVLALLGTTLLAAPLSQPASNSARVADEATKDVKYDPMSVVAPQSAALPVASVNLEAPEVEKIATKAPESDALSLSPYIVRDLPDRTYAKVNESISQQSRLSRVAAYKRDVNHNFRAEFVGAPMPGGITGRHVDVPLLSFSW